MEWNGDKILARVLGIITGFVAVVIIIVYCWDSSPKHVTLGMLAYTANDYRGRRVVIRNAGNGKRDGRFLIFDCKSTDRYDVVFIVSPEVKPGVSTFEGYVFGIFEDRIPGCPHDPPFLLVLDVKPIVEVD